MAQQLPPRALVHLAQSAGQIAGTLQQAEDFGTLTRCAWSSRYCRNSCASSWSCFAYAAAAKELRPRGAAVGTCSARRTSGLTVFRIQCGQEVGTLDWLSVQAQQLTGGVDVLRACGYSVIGVRNMHRGI